MTFLKSLENAYEEVYKPEEPKYKQDDQVFELVPPILCLSIGMPFLLVAASSRGDIEEYGYIAFFIFSALGCIYFFAKASGIFPLYSRHHTLQRHRYFFSYFVYITLFVKWSVFTFSIIYGDNNVSSDEKLGQFEILISILGVVVYLSLIGVVAYNHLAGQVFKFSFVMFFISTIFLRLESATLLEFSLLNLLKWAALCLQVIVALVLFKTNSFKLS